MSNKHKYLIAVIVIALLLIVIVYFIYERKIEAMEQIVLQTPL